MLNRLLSGILSLILLFFSQHACAHRDDYIDETLVYLTLEKHELELEYWLDSGHRSQPTGRYIRHNIAAEWGVTDQWMVYGRLTTINDNGSRLDSARVETRYRFSDEGVMPIDVAASLEINAQREADNSTTTAVEPRLILSRDFGEKLNLTSNFSEEIPVDTGKPVFLTALGARYNWTNLLRVGSELQYNFDEHAGSVIPQVWLAFEKDVTLKLGYSVGFDKEPGDFARLALEVEL